MISRIWKATATERGAAAYAEHFRAHVIPSMARLDGYEGAMLLQRQSGERVDVLVISFWRSEEAITAFAGPDIQRAVVATDARRALECFDETVTHFAVIAHDATDLK